MWEKIFFPTFLVLRVCTCIKVRVLFCCQGKVSNNSSKYTYFKDFFQGARGALDHVTPPLYIYIYTH